VPPHTTRRRAREAPLASLRRGLTASVLFGALSLLFPADAAAKPNFLVIVIDDIGADKLALYGATDPARTPNMDALAADGVLFQNAWSSPTCSPTRASALTGRLPERTGVGAPLRGERELSTDETTLAQILGAEGYATAAIGKWHLSSRPTHPLELGFDTHRGTPGNIGDEGYSIWRKYVDGVDLGLQYRYVTTETADDAIAWVRGQTRPWFAWVAFHAAHRPLHRPPSSLHRYGGLAGTGSVRHFNAIVEALHTELGRLLGTVGDDTTILLFSDNGTYELAIAPPFSPAHGKGSPYELAINIPFLVAGSAVPPANRGTSSDALIHVSDIFATLAELAGSDASAADSVSFVPQLLDAAQPGRHVLYTSGFRPNGGPPKPEHYKRAARDERFKLIRSEGHAEQLFDLDVDPYERNNLLENALTPASQAARDALARVIDENEWLRHPPGARGIPATWLVLLIALGVALTYRWRRRTRRPA